MKVSEHAAQIWLVLIFAAYHHQTIGYETLSRLIGAPRTEIPSMLVPVQRYCLDRGIPDVTSIVASALGEEPAPALSDVRSVHAEVFHHPWLDEATPSPDDFEPFSLPS